jgi:hypothetical protein
MSMTSTDYLIEEVNELHHLKTEVKALKIQVAELQDSIKFNKL